MVWSINNFLRNYNLKFYEKVPLWSSCFNKNSSTIFPIHYWDLIKLQINSLEENIKKKLDLNHPPNAPENLKKKTSTQFTTFARAQTLLHHGWWGGGGQFREKQKYFITKQFNNIAKLVGERDELFGKRGRLARIPTSSCTPVFLQLNCIHACCWKGRGRAFEGTNSSKHVLPRPPPRRGLDLYTQLRQNVKKCDGQQLFWRSLIDSS